MYRKKIEKWKTRTKIAYMENGDSTRKPHSGFLRRIFSTQEPPFYIINRIVLQIFSLNLLLYDSH